MSKCKSKSRPDTGKQSRMPGKRPRKMLKPLLCREQSKPSRKRTHLPRSQLKRWNYMSSRWNKLTTGQKTREVFKRKSIRSMPKKKLRVSKLKPGLAPVLQAKLQTSSNRKWLELKQLSKRLRWKCKD